jgi:hypothetical protein
MVMVKTKIATLGELLATRARAVFPYRINFQSLGYNNIDQMKEWCETNCNGLWRTETFHAIYWQFENDYDATMFMLRWGSAEGNKLK